MMEGMIVAIVNTIRGGGAYSVNIWSVSFNNLSTLYQVLVRLGCRGVGFWDVGCK